MEKSCKQCNSQFIITDEDLKFYDKVSPIFDNQKFPIPPPEFCPDCRHQRRLAFRNERKLYHRNCDLTGKEILSIYSPDSPYKVYERDAWWSDKWNALDYGRDFDFSKTFSEQLQELYQVVPTVNLYNTNIENSQYTNYALNQKNCYLIFGAGDNENCMYGKFIVECKDTVDCLSVFSCELCYEGVASEKCYNCKFFTNCRSCNNCSIIEDCSNCNDCIGCFGLRNKQYCIFNKQYTKEDYEKLKQECEHMTAEKIESIKYKLEELKKTLPRVQSHIYASENCTGDGVFNSKNCFNAFDCKNCEDCKYIHFSPNTIHTYDCAFCAPDGNRFCYNLCSTVDLENSMACFFAWHGNSIYYSMNCHHNNDIFGCVGLKNQKHCILNKQYTKEEYEKVVAKIIKHMESTGEWGDYFPYKTSPFAYNETIAQEYFPLNKEQTQQIGSKWKDEPDNNNKQFKITPQETAFYKKMTILEPTIHPDQRHQNRLKLHNSYSLHKTKCDKCDKNIEAIYIPENKQKIYCEKCYLEEIY